jgi:hypothetical protein
MDTIFSDILTQNHLSKFPYTQRELDMFKSQLITKQFRFSPIRIRTKHVLDNIINDSEQPTLPMNIEMATNVLPDYPNQQIYLGWKREDSLIMNAFASVLLLNAE